MDRYKVQFTYKDVLRRTNGLSPDISDSLRHDLKSDTAPLKNYASNAHVMLAPKLSIFERAYLENLTNIGTLVAMGVNNLFAAEVSRHGAALSIVSDLEDLREYLPATPLIRAAVPDLSSRESQTLAKLDAGGRRLIYTFNAHFAPSFQRDSHLLDADLEAKIHDDWFPTLWVNKREIPPIETKLDWATNVVVPLFRNADEHARVGDERLRVDIYADVGEEYILHVADWGKGVAPEMRDKLLREPASTKPADGSQHGLGLIAIKRFAEEQGGRIWLQDRPEGDGTRFSVAIPYRTIEGGIYRQ